jgi:hypothetical protein
LKPGSITLAQGIIQAIKVGHGSRSLRHQP